MLMARYRETLRMGFFLESLATISGPRMPAAAQAVRMTPKARDVRFCP